MARFSGKIGFVITTETRPGIYEPTETERAYRGDLITRRVRVNLGDTLNPALTLSNEISVVADSFAVNNVGYMRYVYLNGIKWSIESASVAYPRITLSIGGIYNG